MPAGADVTPMADITRAEMHMGICRYCFGTGETHKGEARVTCPECDGNGCLA